MTDVPDAIQRLNMRSVRKWTTLALTRARLLETSKQRGQREMIVDAFNYTAFSQVVAMLQTDRRRVTAAAALPHAMFL